jgi:hypothetical protein
MIELLFQVELRHPYYVNGLFENCQLTADGGTQQVMAQYQLIKRTEQGVFGLYTSFQDSAIGFVAYLCQRMNGLPLRFLLTCSNALFVFISDIPLNWVGQVEMSSKSGNSASANEGGAADEMLINLAPRLSEQSASENVIGTILIYPDDLLNLFAAGKTKIRYVVQFQVRKLHWIYYLINRTQTRLNNPTVCNKKGVCFNGPTPVVLPGAGDALEFNSGARQFALQQVPTEIFDLMDSFTPPLETNGQTVERTLIKGLPTPTAEQLGVKQVDGNPYVFGAMNVYL